MALRDVNVPIGGFIKAAEANGHELTPVIWAGASASAHVTTDAFERIGGEIIDAVRQGGFDAIYLDLHGAMVTEHLDDGEGEILERVRQIVGDRMPVVVSLDLHANVTARMFRHASALVAYRTYPHVDMAETGERAARILERLVSEGRPLQRAVRRVPFLIPVNGMCTLVAPATRHVRVAGRSRGRTCRVCIVRARLSGGRFSRVRADDLGVFVQPGRRRARGRRTVSRSWSRKKRAGMSPS